MANGDVRGEPKENQVPWVCGLRPRLEIGRWCDLLAALLLGQFTGIRSGEKTRQAEEGLRIPACWYWYVGRTEGIFGRSVLFWDCSKAIWEAAERGVCPFDTGGLWHGYVKVTDALDDEAKRALFCKYDRDLPGWDFAFAEHVRAHHASLGAYVRGEPPDSRAVPEIVKGEPNGSQAWTWEARVPRNRVVDRVQVTRVYLIDEDQAFFLNWVEDARDLSLEERKTLVRWVVAYGVTVSRPDEAWKRAQADLLGLGGELGAS